MLLVNRAARRTARDAYFTAQDQAAGLVTALWMHADPAERAGILRELSVKLHNLADLRVPAWGRHDWAAAVGDREDAYLADLIADVERDRAACGVRQRSDWTEVEHAGGELLDRLADPTLTDSARALLYVQLQDAVAPVLTGAGPGEILATISHSHRRLAGEAHLPARLHRSMTHRLLAIVRALLARLPGGSR